MSTPDPEGYGLQGVDPPTYPQILHVLDSVFGALPFLPRGKGALILILGGMLVLALSLFWSFVIGRRQQRRRPHRLQRVVRAREGRAEATSLRDRMAPSRARVLEPAADWVRSVMSTASRAGLGRPTLLRSEPVRHVILIEDCRSCRGRRHGSGCEVERDTLEQVMRTFAPRGRVVEVACNASPAGSCTFELRPGALRP